MALLPSPRTSDTNGAGHHGDGGIDLRTAVAEIPLLPTPAVNDMGAAYTPEQWDAWTAEMKARHNNGNGHGPSLNVEVQRMLLPTPRATDGTKGGPNQRGSSGDLMLPSAVNLLPTPTAQDASQSGGSTASDITLTDAVVRTKLGRQENARHAISTEGRPGEELRGVRNSAGSEAVQEWAPGGSERLPQAEALFAELREQSPGCAGQHAPMEGSADQAARPVRGVRDDRPRAACTSHRPGRDEQPTEQPDGAVRVLSSSSALAGGPRRSDGVDFGPYSPAIERWESVLGRQAPAPTKLNSKGSPKLSDEFDEFLMGYPGGWITDVPGVTWNETLKACGNGVVPQQGSAAVRWLRVMASWEVTA